MWSTVNSATRRSSVKLSFPAAAVASTSYRCTASVVPVRPLYCTLQLQQQQQQRHARYYHNNATTTTRHNNVETASFSRAGRVLLWSGVTATAVGAALATPRSVHAAADAPTPTTNQSQEVSAAEAGPRVVSGVYPNIALYNWDLSPFCGKVRAYLNYHNVGYKIHEVNALTRSQIAFSKDYKKLPIIVIDGVQVNDSEVILQYLRTELEKRGLVIPLPPLSEQQAEIYKNMDKFVGLFALNRNRSLGEIYHSCGTILENDAFSPLSAWTQRIVMSCVLFLMFQRKAWAYPGENGGLSPRQVYHNTLNQLFADLPGPFFGGNEVNQLDLTLYGIVHVGDRDQSMIDAQAACPKFAAWYRTMYLEIEKQRTKRVWAVSMSCNGCVNAVRKALEPLAGIDQVYINLEQKKVITRGTASWNEIARALDTTGKAFGLIGFD